MAGTPERFNYDPSKPVEGQLQTFLNGRNPYGTIGDNSWQNVYDPRYYNQTQSDPDESGTTHSVFTSKDPRLSYYSGADSPYLIDGRFGAVSWAPTTDPNGIKEPNGATGYVKPDNMYSYNNLYYDPTYGLVRDGYDYRDPHAKTDALTNAAIMAVVGGAGFGAAAAAEGAAGAAGSGTYMGQTVPQLANAGIKGVSTLNGAYNPDNPTLQGIATGGKVAANPNTQNYTTQTDPSNPRDGRPYWDSPFPEEGGDTNSDNGFLGTIGNALGINNLGDLGLAGLGKYFQNQNNQGYKEDFNNMITVGTGGVTNADRAGARNLVTGVYNDTIPQDQIFNNVPGLRAISDRGAADIGRQMSAHGDSDPQSSARMREFINFNNDLTSKAYDREMNRAMQVGGFNFNPSAVAGKGMDALGSIYGNNRNDINSLAALAARGGLGSGANGGALSGGLGAIAKGGGSLLRSIFGGAGLGGDPFSSGIDWSSTDGWYDPTTAGYIEDGANSATDAVNQYTSNWGNIPDFTIDDPSQYVDLSGGFPF